jgi:hypothetical protein
VPAKSAIVLVIDRLGSAYLGPYGNTWIETPAINRWASQSRLWENALSDSPSLPALYRSYWQGLPAICSDLPNDVTAPVLKVSLPGQLADAGIESTLITDCPWLYHHLQSDGFDLKTDLSREAPETMASNVGQTQFGQMIAGAIQWVTELEGPSLLWMHAQACDGFWDAPYVLRNHFTEEGDPPPSDCVDPPNLVLEKNADPDQQLAVLHAYAGQVMTIDTCLAALQRTLEDVPAGEEPLLIVTSPRGFPLGEHGRIGPRGDDLFAEVLQVPLLVRDPRQELAGQRVMELVQPVDIHSTLREFFELPSPPRQHRWGKSLLAPVEDLYLEFRQFVSSVHENDWSIRTPIWFLRDSTNAELFAKPDDRWEVNEVASRCGEVVDGLRDAIHKVRLAGGHGDSAELPVLADELVSEG